MEVITEIAADGTGLFYCPGTSGAAAEMNVSIAGGILTVHHTEVKKEFENQGLAKKLLGAMVDYAREQHLTVNPLCPFVSLQFRRHPELYAGL